METDRTRETNIVKNHLGRIDAREDVVTMGRRIRDLVESEGWQIVTGLLAQMRHDTLLQLEQDLHDQATYTYNHGRLRGMRAVEAIVAGVSQAAMVADRDLQELAGQTARQET